MAEDQAAMTYATFAGGETAMLPRVRGLQGPTAWGEVSVPILKEKEAGGRLTSRRSNLPNTQARLKRCGLPRSPITLQETGIRTALREEVVRQVEEARKAEGDTRPPARELQERPTRPERVQQEAASQAPSLTAWKEPLAKSTVICDARAPPPANGSP